MSKGSTRRPSNITLEQWDQQWDQIFKRNCNGRENSKIGKDSTAVGTGSESGHAESRGTAQDDIAITAGDPGL